VGTLKLGNSACMYADQMLTQVP